VRDITRKLSSLVQPSDDYLLLLFHLLLTTYCVGGDEVAVHSARVIKRDFRALGWLVRKSGALVIFSSLLPAVGGDVARNRQTDLLIHGSTVGVTNTALAFLTTGWLTWHQACWHQMGFTFLKGERRSLLKSLQG